MYVAVVYFHLRKAIKHYGAVDALHVTPISNQLILLHRLGTGAFPDSTAFTSFYWWFGVIFLLLTYCSFIDDVPFILNGYNAYKVFC